MPARTRTERTGIVIAANFPARELLATSFQKRQLALLLRRSYAKVTDL